MVCVNNEVESLAGHEIQGADCRRLDVAVFGGDDCEIVILNLHEKRAHIDTGIDQPEAIL